MIVLYVLAVIGAGSLLCFATVLVLLAMAVWGPGENAVGKRRAVSYDRGTCPQTPGATALARLNYDCDRMQQWADARTARIECQRVRCAAGLLTAPNRVRSHA